MATAHCSDFSAPVGKTCMPSKTEIKISLRRRADQKVFGFVADEQGCYLQVRYVYDGILGNHNQANPDAAVRPGDHIKAINGYTGDAKELKEVLKSNAEVMEMTIIKTQIGRRPPPRISPYDKNAMVAKASAQGAQEEHTWETVAVHSISESALHAQLETPPGKATGCCVQIQSDARDENLKKQIDSRNESLVAKKPKRVLRHVPTIRKRLKAGQSEQVEAKEVLKSNAEFMQKPQIGRLPPQASSPVLRVSPHDKIAVMTKACAQRVSAQEEQTLEGIAVNSMQEPKLHAQLETLKEKTTVCCVHDLTDTTEDEDLLQASTQLATTVDSKQVQSEALDEILKNQPVSQNESVLAKDPKRVVGDVARNRKRSKAGHNEQGYAISLAAIVRLLPKHLAAPTETKSHVYQFWNFIAQALLGSEADDNICRAFKLGGTVDNLSDIAFIRDNIVARYGGAKDMHSVVWHFMLISWLGAGGPHQRSYKWLCAEGLAKPYSETDTLLVTDIYRRIEALASQRGFSHVFDGDSRAVKFRLDSKQQGESVLQSWFQAVPQVARILKDGVSPRQLDRELRSIFFVGELTAKELYIMLSYAQPDIADTVCYTPVGPGARDGAMIVLSGEVVACAEQRPCSPEPDRGKKRRAVDRVISDSLQATKLICDLQHWALQDIPRLARACADYRASAPHRDDPLRNGRIKRPYLFDLADIEVMLCYYKNFIKLRQRFGDKPLPAKLSVRGWERRL